MQWNRRDLGFMVGLFVVALLVRALFIHWPQEVVFDEVHFGKFVTAYCCTHENIFDIHPPHGKLLIAGVAYLGGYRGDFVFEHIGDPYPSASLTVWLRLVSALAGAVVPLLVYLLLRRFDVRPLGALVGGGLAAFDNALVVQSRLIALDPMLMAATLGAVACYLWAEIRSGKRRWGFLIAAGVLAGLAAGVKFTGLAALGLLGLRTVWNMLAGRSWHNVRAWAGRGIVVLLVALGVYAAGWALHYLLLTEPGPGDAWQQQRQGLVADAVEMHKIMFEANYNLTATHPYSSMWWTWPILQRPVFYWQGDNSAVLYLIGNPIVWWATTALGLLVVLGAALRLWPLKGGGWLLLAGYAVSLLPLIRVPRALFLYHYFTPLLFSLMLVVWWADRFLLRDTERQQRRWAYGIALAVGILFFVIFLPRTYGLPVPQWQEALYWFESWR